VITPCSRSITFKSSRLRRDSHPGYPQFCDYTMLHFMSGTRIGGTKFYALRKRGAGNQFKYLHGTAKTSWAPT
jgi:hypothetical protein